MQQNKETRTTSLHLTTWHHEEGILSTRIYDPPKKKVQFFSLVWQRLSDDRINWTKTAKPFIASSFTKKIKESLDFWHCKFEVTVEQFEHFLTKHTLVQELPRFHVSFVKNKPVLKFFVVVLFIEPQRMKRTDLKVSRCFCGCFMWLFSFYHGKSAWNHLNLLEYGFLLVPTTLSKSKCWKMVEKVPEWL